MNELRHTWLFQCKASRLVRRFAGKSIDNLKRTCSAFVATQLTGPKPDKNISISKALRFRNPFVTSSPAQEILRGRDDGYDRSGSFAVIHIMGRPLWIELGRYYDLHRINQTVGNYILLHRILFLRTPEGYSLLGRPFIENVRIFARIINHFRGKKKHIYRFQPKKHVSTVKGFRQELTRVRIEEIEMLPLKNFLKTSTMKPGDMYKTTLMTGQNDTNWVTDQDIVEKAQKLIEKNNNKKEKKVNEAFETLNEHRLRTPYETTKKLVNFTSADPVYAFFRGMQNARKPSLVLKQMKRKHNELTQKDLSSDFEGHSPLSHYDPILNRAAMVRALINKTT